MKITMITSNEGKWKVAHDIFQQYNVELDHVAMETPEIQSLDVTEVAEYSAQYACEKLGVPVIKSDVAYYIEGLNGFPGPFIKFINKTLTPQQMLDLMSNVTDRQMTIKECLALAIPGQEPICFTCDLNTQIATQAEGEGSTIDQIMVLDGFTKPRGTLTQEQAHEFFSKSVKVYHDMAKHLEASQL